MAQEKQDNQTEQIELFSYDPIVLVWDVVKRWKVIVAVALLAGMLAYVVTEQTYTPAYTTTTTFVVSAKESSTTAYQNLNAASSLATVFSEVLNSSIMRDTILEELGMDAFDGSIQASAVAETNLLSLNVTHSDPRTAFLVTKTIIEKHGVVSYQVTGDTILEVLQKPVVPSAPSNPMNAAGSMKKVAVLAGLAACAVLAVASFMRDTVRSRQEAEKKLEERVMGELRHEHKHQPLKEILRHEKRSILITDPITSFGFVEKIKKLRRQVEQHMPENGKVIMVTSVLENEGKSTVAVNLALSMAQKQKKVLLIDGDLRRPACHKVLEQPWRAMGTADVAMGKMGLMKAVAPCKKLKNLSLLLESREWPDSADLVSSAGMEKLLEEARENYDWVIVDTPPMSVGPDSECMAEQADASLLVVRQNDATAKMLTNALDVLHMSKAKMLGCVLNNVWSVSMPGSGSYGGSGYGYGYGAYSHYGHYGRYGAYGKTGGKSDKVGNHHEA